MGGRARPGKKLLLAVDREVHLSVGADGPVGDLSLELNLGDTKDHLDGVLCTCSKTTCKSNIPADNILYAAVTTNQISIVRSDVVGNLHVNSGRSRLRDNGEILTGDNHIVL